jgi:hypothetical protein
MFLRSVFQLTVTANIVLSLLIPSTPMMEAVRSSETLVLTTAARSHISEDGILHSHRCGNIRSSHRIEIALDYIRKVRVNGL